MRLWVYNGIKQNLQHGLLTNRITQTNNPRGISMIDSSFADAPLWYKTILSLGFAISLFCILKYSTSSDTQRK